MEINYVVLSNIHLKNPAGWVYKVETGGRDYNAAEKAFYTISGNYLHDDTHDKGTVMLVDSLGNTKISKSWNDTEPEPEPNEG